MPNLPKPLPCPFCGSTPLLWSAGTPEVDYVGCKTKECVKPKTGTTAGHALAIATWNRRAMPRGLTGDELLEWAKRHDLRSSVTELNNIAEDIRTIEYSSVSRVSSVVKP